jgi:hypothetical protein
MNGSPAKAQDSSRRRTVPDSKWLGQYRALREIDRYGPSVRAGPTIQSLARNSCSLATAWLIVNDAASCRGGNSLKVSRNWVTIAPA